MKSLDKTQAGLTTTADEGSFQNMTYQNLGHIGASPIKRRKFANQLATSGLGIGSQTIQDISPIHVSRPKGGEGGKGKKPSSSKVTLGMMGPV
jgi:hypothetical protein